MMQKIEYSKLCHTGQTAALHRSGEHNIMAALGYVNSGKTNFVLASTLYLFNWHRHQDIRPSHPCVSPRTDLGP